MDLKSLRAKIGARIPAFIRAKGWGYWVTVTVLTVGLMILGPYIERDWLNLEGPRNWLFQNMSQSPLNPAEPRYDVKVVAIEDDQFWSADMAGRSPANRKYLGNLIARLDDLGADVIALDFDLRLPNPERVEPESEPYASETKDLVDAIVAAANHNRTVVLARTLGRHKQGGYPLEADAYLPYGICSQDERGNWTNPGLPPQYRLTPQGQANIVCGYISLPRDMRRVPPPVRVLPRGTLDSFALAIVRSKDDVAAHRIGSEPKLATYIPRQEMEDAGVLVSAGDLWGNHPAAQKKVRGAIVIVGGAWYPWARGRGPGGEPIDIHDTPTGAISGALIHANFVQAILSDRLFPQVGDPVLTALEFIFCVAAAILFATPWADWLKGAIFVGFAAGFFVIQWLALHVFGAFFEAFLPFCGVVLHALGHRVLPHRAAHSATMLGTGGPHP